MKISVVLVVDDNEADQYLTKIVLEDYDSTIKVEQAYDGQQALDMIDSMEEKPDVIFLDINMPGMNGFGFLEQYNKREVQVAVISMLTSSEQNSDREKSMAYDCVKAYFVKPIGSDDLDYLKNL